ncbi:hypothetical protein JTE90_001091 [Oedothorax gibbosus]|uniref:Uncharacterized protein n=1 Tax=Oedothorax gibbosus TaxID=931172 RepID=A0AAV6UJI5_9ARAC|nr:hypothetical protein JTE90_001091 [Oedothorax gibbosus]
MSTVQLREVFNFHIRSCICFKSSILPLLPVNFEVNYNGLIWRQFQQTINCLPPVLIKKFFNIRYTITLPP